MKSLQDYTIVIRPDANGTFVAYVPAIVGCHAWGETADEARAELADVFDMVYQDTETYIDTYEDFVSPPSRGRTGAKKFTLNIDGELLTIRAQKSLTIQALCAWLKTWASPNAKIVTPGNRTHSLDGEKLAHQAHFVYFILNQDSNAIKIGRAKDLAKRMKALQTSSPAKLRLIKSVQVEGGKEAQELEQSLHRQFNKIRLAGEWFKADESLLEYISQL